MSNIYSVEDLSTVTVPVGFRRIEGEFYRKPEVGERFISAETPGKVLQYVGRNPAVPQIIVERWSKEEIRQAIERLERLLYS